MSSARWALGIGAMLAFAASEAPVAAFAGASLPRTLGVAGAAVGFVGSYVVCAQPGRCEYEGRDLRPVLATLACVLAAIAITGGIGSPMIALLVIPFVTGWTLFSGTPHEWTLAALVPVALAGLVLLPASVTNAGLTHAGSRALAVWSTLLAFAVVRRRVGMFLRTFHDTRGKLDLVRNGALSDADSRRRGLEKMAMRLAHELKNPLAAIKSLVQLQRRQATDEKSQRRLDVIAGEAERMERIVGDYLTLARPMDEMRVTTVAIEQLMDEVVALLSGRAEAAGVELHLHGGRGAIEGDPRLLKEAIVNLASNALLATRRGGVVDLRYDVDTGVSRIIVRDTGAGMTREVFEKVGTPFFTTREGGTGLGVAIARAAIAQHRGTLEYTSIPGVGTVATVTLPAVLS